MVRTKIVHTAGSFFEHVRKNVQIIIYPMFPYTVKYTESEYDIQNNDLLYKAHPKHQNIFEIWKSKSTVYPQKQTRTDASGHAIESLNRCASFMKQILF